MAKKSSFYMPELDVLRALAFAAVFVSHWLPHDPDYYSQRGVPALLAQGLSLLSFAGATGVMVFFCLSSYLITKLLLKEIDEHGEVAVGAFYMRRLLRIWPLYMLFTALAALLPFVDSSQEFGWESVLAFIFFSGNWLWSLGTPGNTVAAPLWSISVEEQFYLCWPWVVRRLTRRGLRNAAFGLLAVAFINRLLVVTHVLGCDLWHNTLTQFDSIALGALVAVGVTDSLEPLKRRGRWVLLAAGAAGLYAAQLVTGPFAIGWASLVYFPLVSLSCALILWAFIGMQLDWASGTVRTLLYLGQISYGLYVLHCLSFYLVDELLPRLGLRQHAAFVGRGVMAMLLTIVLATISYYGLERPFLRLKGRFGAERAPREGSRAAEVAVNAPELEGLAAGGSRL